MSKGGRPLKVDTAMVNIRTFVEEGDIDSLGSLFVEHGVEAFDSNGRTAFTWASFFGNLEILDWLVKQGANVDHQDGMGYCGVHYAIQEKRFETVRALIDYQANVNLTDKYGNSPLWTAVMNAGKDYRFVRLLVTAGADPEQVNVHGKSPGGQALEMYGKAIGLLGE